MLKRQCGPKVPLVALEQLEVIPKTWREGGSLKNTWFQLDFHTVLGNLQLMASRSLNVTLFVFNEKDNNDEDVQPWFNSRHSSVATVS